MRWILAAGGGTEVEEGEVAGDEEVIRERKKMDGGARITE